MKLTQRETKLLVAFASLFVVLIGGGMVWSGIQSLSGIVQGNAELAQRVDALQTAVDHRAVWESRDQWLNEHTETFQSREDAAAALLNHIEECARDAEMQLTGREIVEAPEPEAGSEGEPRGALFPDRHHPSQGSRHPGESPQLDPQSATTGSPDRSDR